MTINGIQQAWKSYQDAWADIPLAERERLLKESVTEDVAFASPQNEGQSFDGLMRNIADFQKQFPGASFKSHKLIAHHGQLLAAWKMFNKDGSEFLAGHSYARFNEDGRLTQLAGFWEL